MNFKTRWKLFEKQVRIKNEYITKLQSIYLFIKNENQ